MVVLYTLDALERALPGAGAGHVQCSWALVNAERVERGNLDLIT